MVNLAVVESFQWDERNARKSEDKHGVSQNEAERVFSNVPLLLLNDDRHSSGELRYHAYGRTDSGRLLQVSFTLRDDGRAIRVISTRAMSTKERSRYEEEI